MIQNPKNNKPTFFGTPLATAMLAAVLALTLGVPGARAQSANKFAAPSIGVLDVQRISREATAANALRTQLDAKQNEYTAEIKKKEDELRAAGQELERQATILKEDKLADKRKEVEQKYGDLQRLTETRRRQVEQSLSVSMREIEGALVGVVQDIAQKRGIDVVLQKAQVFYIGKDIDITEEALVALNQKLPTVKLKVSDK